MDLRQTWKDVYACQIPGKMGWKTSIDERVWLLPIRKQGQQTRATSCYSTDIAVDLTHFTTDP